MASWNATAWSLIPRETVAEHLERFVFPKLIEEARDFDIDRRAAEIIAEERRVQQILGPSILKSGYGFVRFPIIPCGPYSHENKLMACALFPEIMERHFSLQADLRSSTTAPPRVPTWRANLPPLYRLDHDMADSRGTLVDIRSLDGIWFPHFARSIEPCSTAGIRLIWHCDGNLMEMVPRLLDVGLAGFQGFQYEDGMDYERICRMKDRDGDDLIIIARRLRHPHPAARHAGRREARAGLAGRERAPDRALPRRLQLDHARRAVGEHADLRRWPGVLPGARPGASRPRKNRLRTVGVAPDPPVPAEKPPDFTSGGTASTLSADFFTASELWRGRRLTARFVHVRWMRGSSGQIIALSTSFVLASSSPTHWSVVRDLDGAVAESRLPRIAPILRFVEPSIWSNHPVRVLHVSSYFSEPVVARLPITGIVVTRMSSTPTHSSQPAALAVMIRTCTCIWSLTDRGAGPAQA